MTPGKSSAVATTAADVATGAAAAPLFDIGTALGISQRRSASIYCSPAAFPSLRDINTSGTIVVTDYTLTSATQMYRWKSGAYQTIPAPPDIPEITTRVIGEPSRASTISTTSLAITNTQYVMVIMGSSPHAAHSSLRTAMAAQSKLLGVHPGGRRSFGRDLNSSGVAVGGAEKPLRLSA